MSQAVFHPRRDLSTHQVTNQPGEPEHDNLFTQDTALAAAVEREGGHAGRARLVAYGDVAARELWPAGFEAETYPPTLTAFDRFGQRIDEVRFHPAYHHCMQRAREHGLHSLTWTHGPGAQVMRSALFYMHNQVEAGTACPTTMTHAAVPVLRRTLPHDDPWLAKILATEYDPSCRPARDKTALSIGMGMTEKQGGSDVRTNTTRAIDAGDGSHRLTGHKWFFSAPMSDAFIVLAQEDRQGLSCFLLPRWQHDGQRNGISLMQLKNKLGDRSNASAEVEFVSAVARRLGAPGRGVATILEMVAQTRLDCMLGSAGLMRAALVQALHHARRRQAFGAALVDQPLHARVLADLAIESEAALALSMRLARAFEANDEHDRLLARLATPIGKYWICKSAPAFVNEAQECLGGAGYVETSLMPRLFRQSPLNSIWEGAGNIQCLDMLRALERHPDSRAALIETLDATRHRHPAYDTHLERLIPRLTGPIEAADARRLAGDIAQALQAALLLGSHDSWIGEAFCQTRFGIDAGRVYGSADPGPHTRALIDRAWPA